MGHEYYPGTGKRRRVFFLSSRTRQYLDWRMFKNCIQLTSVPESLPAETLENYCYKEMFKGCTSLSQAPALPAEELAISCYEAMFRDCTSLQAAPVLPAEELFDSCYNAMFYGCHSLQSASLISATELADNCCELMFADCTSLKAAPVLSSGQMMPFCYSQMFSGCTGLKECPELPSTVLATSCYSGMFSNCTALREAPQLPATILSKECYYGMFSGCTGLTFAPDLSAEVLAESCYGAMFNGCVSLRTAPALSSDGLALKCYSGMFKDCTSLRTAPELTDTDLAASCYEEMFSGCTSLITAPILSAAVLTNKCYAKMFYGCTSIRSVPDLCAVTLAEECCSQMFYGCTALKTAPGLPAGVMAVKSYQGMFEACTGLQTAPQLPATTLANSCYSSMFAGCTGLRTVPLLPATSLSVSCYSSMFSGCTGLRTIPSLPADTLANNCYSSMFRNCTSLTAVPEFNVTNTASSCFESMFFGCSGIRLSASQNGKYRTEWTAPAGSNSANIFYNTGGTFTGNPVPGTIYYLWDQNCIIRYYANGADSGTVPEDSHSYAVGSIADTLGNSGSLEKVGYTFEGWNTSADGTGITCEEGDSIVVRNDISLYANWKKIPTYYSITYILNGGINDSNNPETYTDISETFTLYDPSRTGYTFGGWYSSSKFTGFPISQIPSGTTGHKTFYAKWDANPYSVIFDGNGATAGTMYSQNGFRYDTGKALIPNAYSMFGHHFKEWNTNADGTGVSYADNAVVNNLTAEYDASVVLYAQWDVNTYTVTFNGNDATSGSMKPMMSREFGTDFALKENTYKKTGYTFAGWNTRKDGKGISYQDEEVVLDLTSVNGATVVLYAQWTVNTYTIAFNGNGSTSGSMKSLTGRKYGTSYTLTAAGYKRTGYTFAGWNTRKNGKGTSFKNKSSVKNLSSANDATVILYAQWTANTYTISFNGNGATSGSMKSLTSRKYGTSYTLASNLYKRSGYTFVGWNTRKDGKGTSYKNKASIKNLTSTNKGTVVLYAIWKKK